MLGDLTPQGLQEKLRPLYAKYDFVRAWLEKESGLNLSVNPRQTNCDPVPLRRGIVISILHRGVFYEASTSLLHAGDLDKLIRGLQESLEQYRFDGERVPLSEEDEMRRDFESIQGEDYPLAKKIETARKVLQKILNASPQVNMAQVRYRHIVSEHWYLSQKKTLTQTISRFEAIFIALLKNESGSAQVYDGYSAHGGWEQMFPDDELIEKMIDDGEKILGARRLKPGTYDCIFDPSMAGMLAHEAFGHGTEADSMAKGRAQGSNYLGKEVASPKVRLYDSPQLQSAAASYFFDHEGQLASETKIVEAGILNRPITDHRSASVLGVPRSPNGRREAYDHKVYTRMSNTYFKEGSDALEDMIASISDGYMVSRATNGMEDPLGWGIQLEALMARRIRDGKLTDEVYSPVIVTGYVPEILKSISMVSDTMEINGLGMCGKGYKEWVKVTDGGPYLRLRARLA